MTFKLSFVSKSNIICLWLNFESVCVCLCLSQDEAFSVFASSRVFSLLRTSQSIESVFKWNVLTEKSSVIKSLSLKIGYKQNKDTEVNWKIFITVLINH